MSDSKTSDETDFVPLPPSYTSEEILQKSKAYIKQLIKLWGPKLFYKWEIDEKTNLPKRKKFKSALLSSVYRNQWYPKTMIDRLGFGEIWYYDYREHIYKPGAGDFFGTVTKIIWKDDFEKSVVGPTIYDIKNSSGIQRENFK
ncbi:unnamed protein product, partial [marine sediment metagenome]